MLTLKTVDKKFNVQKHLAEKTRNMSAHQRRNFKRNYFNYQRWLAHTFNSNRMVD